MRAYMKDKFEFFGIKATKRRELLGIARTRNKLELREHSRQIAKELYRLPQREFHMCAMEIFHKQLRKSYKKEDINDITYLLSTNSWWDSVDFIAKNILGTYLIQYPDQVAPVISDYSESSDMWLNRSSIIFQLGYKTKTNEKILFSQCLKFRHSKEFFIQKAIGWALREYGKTMPENVINFVNSTQLKPLSQKEAIRNILK
jgi:3-methyladenine DNA glycosylase AlkD